MKKNLKAKALSVILALMMVVVFMPTMAFAADGDAASEITVYMTVSDKGAVAKANDDSLMAWKEVKVSDSNGDGKYQYDEALVAVHKQYNTAEGYKVKSGQVKTFWGEDATNSLFFVNGQGLSTGVTVDEVSDGDHLTASINKDSAYYADWYARFEGGNGSLYNMNATAGDKISLKLTGHLGMAWDDEGKKFKPLKDIKIGAYDDKGSYSVISGAVTDSNGNFTVSFDKPGTYVLSAEGTVKGEVTDWNLMGLGSQNSPPFGKMDWTTYESQVAYTDADYGDGPYPAEEIKYIDFFEEVKGSDKAAATEKPAASEENTEETEAPAVTEDNAATTVDPVKTGDETKYVWQTLHYLKSNQLIADCPTIAPVAIMTIEPDEPVTDAGKLALSESKKEAVKSITGRNYSRLSQGDQLRATLASLAGIARINSAKSKSELKKAIDRTNLELNVITTKISGLGVYRGKKKATVKWTPLTDRYDGYQIYYIKKGKKSKAKYTTAAGSRASSKIISKLSKKKYYTFMVRGYKIIDGKAVYGVWSASKRVKIK